MNAIYVLGGLGFVFACGIALASKIFVVKENPQKKLVLELLPGANCGTCGFAGCDDYANCLIDSKSDTFLGKCPVIKEENFKKIAVMLGRELDLTESKVAVINCVGGKKCSDRNIYQGVKTCEAADMIFGGYKSCEFGCLGFGDCIRVCRFEAIIYQIGDVPVIDKQKCTGCGLCVDTCPKKIISLVAQKYDVHIRCSSYDKGSYVRKICEVGCIACGLCMKICPKKAIEISNNLAKIDYTKCSVCGLCVDKCPTGAIELVLPQIY